MHNANYKDLLQNYNNYTHSDESMIVYLVRKLVESIDMHSKWVDVIDFDCWGLRDDKPAYNYFIVEMFERKIHPKFPDESEFIDKGWYNKICKALTWEAAHKDIDQQRFKGVHGPMYLITCPIYNVNRGKKYKKAFPFWNEEYGGFDHTGNVPTTTIYRDVDLEPQWEYKVTGVREIDRTKLKMIQSNYSEFIERRIQKEKHVEIDWFLEDYQATRKLALGRLENKKTTQQKGKPKRNPSNRV